MTPLKVWILEYQRDYEYDLIVGVFSTEKAANDYREERGVPYGYDGYIITEWTIDVPEF